MDLLQGHVCDQKGLAPVNCVMHIHLMLANLPVPET